MARLSIFYVACYALTLTFCANAWTLVYRNETGSWIEAQDGAKNCTRIYHEEGKEFSFDPEGKWCLRFWNNPDCTVQVGITCEGRKWKQFASRNLSAFNVYAMPPSSVSAYFPASSSTTSASSTSSSSSTMATSTTATAAATSATETAQSGHSDDSGSSLGGGAIAGIVIGAVAGVAILAALFFFWGRRKHDAAGSTPAAGPHDASLPEAFSPHHPPMSEIQTQASSVPPYGHPAAKTSKIVELPGHAMEAELSSSRQLVEMDGQSGVKRPDPGI
ncbi:hypothetical protein BBP40_005141 [Aspergillus hancockii]|nr:hypothetical protein BBP40_005141 [Aspergillus hancockii]